MEVANRGSEWGRWDLHVHTKGTAKNDQYGDITFEKFCLEMFRKALDKGIKVIGVTDYFSLENFEKTLAYQKNIFNSPFTPEEQEKIKQIYLIPNLELRISPTTGKNTPVNLHLLFNPLFIEDFKNEILSQIQIFLEANEPYNITKAGLTKLGKKFDSKAKDDDTAYLVGIRAATVEHGEILKALHRSKLFTEECLVFVANGSNDGVSGVNSHDGEQGVLTTTLYNLADGIFSAKPSDIRFFSTQRESEKYNNLKPCIHGSDAHDFDKLFEPDLKRYCWIKSEPSFEGLKQIIHELERVHIGEAKPEMKNPYEVIDRIEIANENFGTQSIYFNPNLNTIIGGRSSGKSTLLKCIAKRLNEEAFNSDKSNDEKTKDFIEELSKDIRIIWRDNAEDDSRQIEYFYQGHMFDKSKEEGIESIIKQILMQRNPLIFNEYDTEIANLKSLNAERVSTLDSKQVTIKNKIRELQSLGNEADITAQIENIDKEISSLNIEQVSPTEIETHSRNKSELGIAKNYSSLILNKINEVNELSINQILSLHLPLSDDEISNLITMDIGKFEESVHNHAIQQLENFKNDAKIKLNQKNAEFLDKISSIENDEKFLRLEKVYSDSDTLRPLQANKKSEEFKLFRINTIKEEVKKLREDCSQIEQDLKATWLEMNLKLNNLLERTNNYIDETIRFEPNLVLMQVEFKKFIEQNIKLISDKATSYANTKVLTVEQLLQLFEQLISDINDDSVKLKSGSSEYVIATEFYTSIWFKPIYDVIYENDRYSQMSQGKKAFVVLKLTLECSERKCPILIDQPEDDLDNRAIFSELVSYLKNKKTQRQIILATHNANVVVNADSELIIVANQHGQKTPNIDEKKFEYKFGSIESMLKHERSSTILDSKTIREHACEILEGGDQAFKLREKRYRLVSYLN